jgi:hypothetical protein
MVALLINYNIIDVVGGGEWGSIHVFRCSRVNVRGKDLDAGEEGD